MKKSVFLAYLIMIVLLGSSIFFLYFSSLEITGHVILDSKSQQTSCEDITTENCTIINNETVCEDITTENCTTIEVQNPTITINSPSDNSYSSASQININFTATSDYLESCWYNLDSGETILTQCNQELLIETSEGQHILTIYTNDTYGTQASASITFTISTQEIIMIISPSSNSFSNNQEITIEYIPVNIEAQSCELTGDLISTDSEIENNQINIFNLSLEEGTYIWNIKCTNTEANETITQNQTLIIDTTTPTINLTEPTGTKTSISNIPLTFSISDTNIDSCLYDVSGQQTAIDCSTTSTTFNVDSEGTYTLILQATDKAGNSNSDSSSFTISTLQEDEDETTSETTTTETEKETEKSSASAEKRINPDSITIKSPVIEIKPLESKTINLPITNTGKDFLNSCKIKPTGEYASWLTSEQIKSIRASETQNFVLIIKTPEEAVPNIYGIDISIECSGVSKATKLNIGVIGKEAVAELTGLERAKENNITVFYTLEETSGFNQNIEVKITLQNESGEIIKLTETKSIEANTKSEYKTTITTQELLETPFNIVLQANIGSFSSSSQMENVKLRGTGFAGLAILENINMDLIKNNLLIVIIISTILVLLAVLIIARKIIKPKQLKEPKKELDKKIDVMDKK